jgi:Spy/CpxP family protein refolding chaperone
MSLLFRLLEASPKIARAFRDFMVGIAVWASVFVGEANLEAFQKWLWGTPQEQQQVLQQLSALDQEVEALFAVFQQHMDAQYQVDILARYVLTLPALPEEGF